MLQGNPTKIAQQINSDMGFCHLQELERMGNYGRRCRYHNKSKIEQDERENATIRKGNSNRLGRMFGKLHGYRNCA